MSKVDPVFCNNASRLQAYRALRNSLVHYPRGGTPEPIAEPRMDIVEDYSRLVAYALHPPTALETIAVRDVFTVTWETPLIQALHHMLPHSFRLAPIVVNGVLEGIFTESTIVEAAVSEKEITINESTTFSDFQYFASLERPIRGVSFLPAEASIVDAEQAFSNAFQQGESISVLLLTENGRPQEALLGLITAHDLPSASGAKVV